ncbi:hypothetical protein AcetOrient_orf03959 [Acetobacter orientalis]|uniref:Uncharacterized protein n=1 Tax=Acetobacter orientalis TaxID=146474 RepID=A0A2Z5ZKT4_9PROT|nr:hypothetical protein AcetOrient_orf03959 [Acetobacter orientalis]
MACSYAKKRSAALTACFGDTALVAQFKRFTKRQLKGG